MIFPPDFIPIEYRGMSLLTGIFLFFLAVGGIAYFWWDRREHSRICNNVDTHVGMIDTKIEDTNAKVDCLFSKVDDTNESLTEIKTNIARTVEAVEWIKRYMQKKD